MTDAERYKLLHGPYGAPRCRLGQKLFCEVRGWVKAERISSGRIPWPQTLVGRAQSPAFILCGDLVKAVQRESNLAVCHWWGVTPRTVTAWRKALDVPRTNEGTARLYRDYTPERLPPEVREQATKLASSPAANRKKAAARRGKPRPPQTVEALRRALQGRKLSAEHREKIGKAHRQRGTRPPKAGPAWAAQEEALLGTLPDDEVARRTGRTVVAVVRRRCQLRIPKYGRRGRGFAAKP